ncbi:MAG: DksA/TraR family C4-type zinc finger protein [Desulfobulbus sp.]|jgi:phage/conjugal plasmid C-4 type zinc finger TraR family protein|nr:DksA/TraR family C4-type zinc finger protein [Desulfobulbus sp.]
MAGGWTRDGAVQDQIDANIEDAVKLARSNIPSGASLEFCEECNVAIPKARRVAVPGVRFCVKCQTLLERTVVSTGGINRRGSKDSQLK